MTDHQSGALDAGARLRRLLAILAYLAEKGQASLAELSARFGIDHAVLVSELELAACCGLPPYTPDQLLELVVDEGSVYAYGLDALRRPPRLTPDEGFALAASARALLAVPGVQSDGALSRALLKLEEALGTSQIAIELDHPSALATLQSATARGQEVEISYLGAARGEETRRVVEPFVVAAREGHFYLDAYCHLAGDWRRFSIERVSSVRLTGNEVSARVVPSELLGERAFAGGPSLRRAHLVIDPSHRSVVERHAAQIEALPDGRLGVDIDVADEYWFGRLLLRLGDHVHDIEPATFAQARRAVARRALERYGETVPTERRRPSGR
jgi:proteasome accessory factor C